MATNLHAALRYNILDRCFRDREHNYQWKDLARQCYEELVEFYPDYKEPSRRSIMEDISNMRSGLLGYEAPIDYDRKEGFHYSNSRFAIHTTPLTSAQVRDMQSAIALLKQVTQNSHLAGITSSIEAIQQRLNLVLPKSSEKQVVFFEDSLNYPGHQWIDVMYRYIQDKYALNIHYLAFDKPKAIHLLSPYILKEYNNRWYVVGYHHKLKMIINLALDRFESVLASVEPYQDADNFDPKEYYKHVYGVTKLVDAEVKHITFKAKPLLSRYLTTKAIHQSQKVVKETEKGTTFSLDLIINYEIIHKFVGYGPDIKVIEPADLVEVLKKKASELTKIYN